MLSSPGVNTLRFVLSITTTFGVPASIGLIPVYGTILGIPAFTTLPFEGITIKESGFILTTFGLIAILVVISFSIFVAVVFSSTVVLQAITSTVKTINNKLSVFFHFLNVHQC